MAVLTHPLVNLESPAAGCGATYPLAPVFDPFSVDALDPEEHGNSSADGAHGVQASTLLRLTTRALGWEHPDLFSDLVVTMPATVFDSSTRSVGLAISGVDSQLLLMFRALFRTCSERLGAAHEDWVQRLLDAALADPTATVGDVAAALKDRLLIAPDIEPVTEAPLVADVFGVPDLDTPAAEAASLASGARIYCGALLSSPQFALRGLPEPAQTGTPRLVVDGADFQNLCERYTAGVPGLQCGEATLTVATPGG